MVAIISDVLGPLLAGRDPIDIPAIWDELYALMRVRGHWSGFFTDAIAGIDIALWDLAGKLAKRSLADLLGGARHASMPAYASGLPRASLAGRVAFSHCRPTSARKVEPGGAALDRAIQEAGEAPPGELDLQARDPVRHLVDGPVAAHRDEQVGLARSLAGELSELAGPLGEKRVAAQPECGRLVCELRPTATCGAVLGAEPPAEGP